MSTAPQPAPGDSPTDAEGFAFLDGHWRVHHQKLKEPLTGRQEWIAFEGSARFFSLLGGMVSVEELCDADGVPLGGAMRTFDRARRIWSDAWVSAHDGVLQPPQHGSFAEGRGTFIAEEQYQGKPILTRGVWVRVSCDEVTWEQACSQDAGVTWETNWKMRFARAAGGA